MSTVIPGLFLVVARASNGVIGNLSGLPWKIPADMRRFRQLTLDKTVIMGRKTFASLPGTLPRRRHVVITRDPEWTAEGVDVAQDEDAALWIAAADDPHAVFAKVVDAFRHLVGGLRVSVDRPPFRDGR